MGIENFFHAAYCPTVDEQLSGAKVLLIRMWRREELDYRVTLGTTQAGRARRGQARYDDKRRTWISLLLGTTYERI